MSAARRKGTSAETAVVDYLRPYAPHVERRALAGAKDRGDVAGIPGVCLEVKNRNVISLSEFVDEAEAEKHNDRADVGAAWIKRRGRGSPGDWYVAMTGAQFVQLLVDAGYLTNPDQTEESA